MKRRRVRNVSSPPRTRLTPSTATFLPTGHPSASPPYPAPTVSSNCTARSLRTYANKFLAPTLNQFFFSEVRRAALLHVTLTAVTSPQSSHARAGSRANSFTLLFRHRASSTHDISASSSCKPVSATANRPWTGDDGGITAGLIAFLTLFDVVGPSEAVAVDEVGRMCSTCLGFLHCATREPSPLHHGFHPTDPQPRCPAAVLGATANQVPTTSVVPTPRPFCLSAKRIKPNLSLNPSHLDSSPPPASPAASRRTYNRRTRVTLPPSTTTRYATRECRPPPHRSAALTLRRRSRRHRSSSRRRRRYRNQAVLTNFW
ncbi:hypothetical protein R3P38DRAFT_3177011 [Favolaschia claudopus]|uniref:Uncharacterized protein n=1 Tax=Favolaschia claudopus TaxID=2862362 RepID=A0AAW0D022_9AGAR